MRINNKKEYDELCEALLLLETKEECAAFLEDICTISEMDAIAQRLSVAKMLRQKMTYLDIAKLSGASTATISRVNRALNYGSNGYNVILDRIEKNK